MDNDQAIELRLAIENLINAKLCDALGRRDGLSRLMGHRASGVASNEIRAAEQVLEDALRHCVPQLKRVALAKEHQPMA